MKIDFIIIQIKSNIRQIMHSSIAINALPPDHLNFNQKVYQQTAQNTPLKFRDYGIVDSYVKKPKLYTQNNLINLQQKHVFQEAPTIVQQQQPFVDQSPMEYKQPVLKSVSKQQSSSWWQKLWGKCYGADNQPSIFANCCGKKQSIQTLKHEHQNQYVQPIPHQQFSHQGQQVVYTEKSVAQPIQIVKQQQPKKQSKKGFLNCCRRDISIRNYKIPIKDLNNVHFASCPCQVCLNSKMGSNQPQHVHNQKQGEIVSYNNENILGQANHPAIPHTDFPFQPVNNQTNQMRHQSMANNNLYNSVDSMQHHHF